MPQPELLHDVVLGQLVQALVRWPAGDSTFELLDDLVAAAA